MTAASARNDAMNEAMTVEADAGALSARITRHVVAAIDAARAIDTPFRHLEFSGVFPDDVYRVMLDCMPAYRYYRSMHGRTKSDAQVNGTPTRTKIDLLPECIRRFPARDRAVWKAVGAALCSAPVREAFRRALAPGLAKRFGADHASVGLYPIPVLTRDVPGYRIPPHTDTHWKGVTVQLYLPSDDANTDIGTIFHAVEPDGSKPKVKQIRFAPNSGYAFAVHDDTWHSVDVLREGVDTRDSILLTYFVDQGPMRLLRNRGKRIGNLIVNEVRQHL
jgi:hypothetical protein